MMFLIFLNCICFILEVELKSNEKENYRILNVLSLIEVSSLFLLTTEIVLKLIDNYRAFFSDGWDLFDFTLLFLVIRRQNLQIIYDTCYRVGSRPLWNSLMLGNLVIFSYLLATLKYFEYCGRSRLFPDSHL